MFLQRQSLPLPLSAEELNKMGGHALRERVSKKGAVEFFRRAEGFLKVIFN